MTLKGALPVSLVAALLIPAGASAAKPLDLHPSKAGPRGANAAQPKVLSGRYLATAVHGRIEVVDDRDGSRRVQPAPSNCGPSAWHAPEVLLRCWPAAAPAFTGPVVVNMNSGSRQRFPPVSAFLPTGPPYRFGVADDGDEFTRLGHSWIAGTYSFSDPHFSDARTLYVSRFTGQRVIEPYAAPPAGIDTPDLQPLPRACASSPLHDPTARSWVRVAGVSKSDPPGNLYLYRCGHRRQLVSRCLALCIGPSVTRRFVAWVGEGGAHLWGRRSHRTFTLDTSNDAYPSIELAEKRAVVVVNDPGAPSAAVYRSIQIPLPRGVR